MAHAGTVEGNDRTHASGSSDGPLPPQPQTGNDVEDTDPSARPEPAARDRGELGQHIREVIERNRKRLQASEARVDQCLAALQDARAHAEREDAVIERQRAAAQRISTSQPATPESTQAPALKEAEELRRLCAEVAANVADTEERIARTHDRLASKRPDKAAEYRETAKQAREQARRAREVRRQFRG
jgi:hypothetical protein